MRNRKRFDDGGIGRCDESRNLFFYDRRGALPELVDELEAFTTAAQKNGAEEHLTATHYDIEAFATAQRNGSNEWAKGPDLSSHWHNESTEQSRGRVGGIDEPSRASSAASSASRGQGETYLPLTPAKIPGSRYPAATTLKTSSALKGSGANSPAQKSPAEVRSPHCSHHMEACLSEATISGAGRETSFSTSLWTSFSGEPRAAGALDVLSA